MSHCYVRWATLIAFAGCLYAGGANAQSAEDVIPRIELKAGDKVPVVNFGGTFTATGPMRCDSDGNIYIRPIAQKVNPTLAPIIRISGDGQHMTQVDLSGVPEIQAGADISIHDFAIGQNGSVFVLGAIGTKKKEYYTAVIEIDTDNKSTSLIHVDTKMSPLQIAALPSGRFLLSGVVHTTETSGKDWKQSSQVQTAIFDGQGTLVKEIEMTGDVKIPDLNSTQKEYPDPKTLVAGLAELAVGEDGTMYFMREGAKPKIWVISATGEVLRQFEVTKPVGNEVPTMFYAGGRLAFAYSLFEPNDNSRTYLLVRIVDPEDGRVLWDYIGRDAAAGLPVCFSGQDFTILSSTPDRHLALLKVAGR
jgi:hypothetical protein